VFYILKNEGSKKQMIVLTVCTTSRLTVVIAKKVKLLGKLFGETKMNDAMLTVRLIIQAVVFIVWAVCFLRVISLFFDDKDPD
jgi:hypothetical protein